MLSRPSSFALQVEDHELAVFDPSLGRMRSCAGTETASKLAKDEASRGLGHAFATPRRPALATQPVSLGA